MSLRLVPGSAFGLLCFASACANVPEHRERAWDRVRSDLAHRLDFEPTFPPRTYDDGSTSDQALALLEGALTEDAAVKIALLENRRVRARLEDLGIAAADLVQAGLLSNPVFSGNAKYFDRGTELELGLAQSFLDLFYLPLRQSVAESELEAAQARVTRELVALTFDVRRAFVDARAARARIELQKRVLDGEQAAYELMFELHRAGNLTDPVLTATEAAVSRAKLDLVEAEADAIVAREPLNVLMGLWGDTTAWNIDGVLDAPPPIDFAETESRAIGSSLELAENRAAIERHARRVGLVRWEALLPVGQLGLAVKRESTDGDWGLGPEVALSIPLFDQGLARRAAADSELRQALNRHVEIAVAVRSAARTIRDRNVMLLDRVRYMRDVDVTLRSRLVLETLRNFNAMQIGVFDVLLAKQAEVQARREHLDAVRETWLARLDLEELLAGSLNPERTAYRPGFERKPGSSWSMEQH